MNAPILSKRIPPGGRHLTSTEQRRLRELGWSCSDSTVVKPDTGCGFYGRCYKPYNRALWSFGPRVTTVENRHHLVVETSRGIGSLSGTTTR